jgi:hypothetical protein
MFSDGGEMICGLLARMTQLLLFVHKSEHQDFKKAKERTWDSASLRAQTLKRD